jgi:hypothetical protein
MRLPDYFLGLTYFSVIFFGLTYFSVIFFGLPG